MATKPTKVPRWLDTTAYPARIVEPAESAKDEGWQPSDKPPAQWVNWLSHVTGLWFAWFNERLFDIIASSPYRGFRLGGNGTSSTPVVELDNDRPDAVNKELGKVAWYDAALSNNRDGASIVTTKENTGGLSAVWLDFWMRRSGQTATERTLRLKATTTETHFLTTNAANRHLKIGPGLDAVSGSTPAPVTIVAGSTSQAAVVGASIDVLAGGNTANGHGGACTVSGGSGAGTNRDGGTASLHGGVSTGQGQSIAEIEIALNGASGTTPNALATVLRAANGGSTAIRRSVRVGGTGTYASSANVDGIDVVGHLKLSVASGTALSGPGTFDIIPSTPVNTAIISLTSAGGTGNYDLQRLAMPDADGITSPTTSASGNGLLAIVRIENQTGNNHTIRLINGAAISGILYPFDTPTGATYTIGTIGSNQYVSLIFFFNTNSWQLIGRVNP